MDDKGYKDYFENRTVSDIMSEYSEQKDEWQTSALIIPNEKKVIDGVVELFCNDRKHYGTAKTLAARSYSAGYVRKFAINETVIALCYDVNLKRRPGCVETPFWIAISDSKSVQSEELIHSLEIVQNNKKQVMNGTIFLALQLQENFSLAEKCEDLKRQIEKYIELINGLE